MLVGHSAEATAVVVSEEVELKPPTAVVASAGAEAVAIAVVASTEAEAVATVVEAVQAAVVVVATITADVDRTRTSAFIIRCTSRIGHWA
jgi:hypothetical protein